MWLFVRERIEYGSAAATSLLLPSDMRERGGGSKRGRQTDKV